MEGTCQESIRNAYKPKENDIAGFDLVGWRHSKEKLVIGATSKDDKKGTTMKNFPEEVSLNGNIYTLEYTKEQGDGLEWGIYV